MEIDKVVFIDFGLFMFRGIFSYIKSKMLPTYNTMNMIMGCLKKVGITENTLVIIAVDSKKGSWRKALDSNYKANRKEAREKYDLDWVDLFKQYNRLIDNIEQSTPFYTVEIEKLEADDIIAFGCKYFNEHQCTIISSDQDYEQLVAYGNVRLFSPVSKQYKLVKNPYSILAKKIQKEASDNLITPILNEKDYEIRNAIVNLIELPNWVNSLVENYLSILPEKNYNTDLICFNSIRAKFNSVYSTKYIVNFEKSINRNKKKKKEKSLFK